MCGLAHHLSDSGVSEYINQSGVCYGQSRAPLDWSVIIWCTRAQAWTSTWIRQSLLTLRLLVEGVEKVKAQEVVVVAEIGMRTVVVVGGIVEELERKNET